MESTVQFNTKFMLDSCSTWNLADDVELLKHLEKFSEGIVRKATVIGKCMDGLEESLTLTYLKVKNVSNEFHSVGDTHFVENRAHDEDETITTFPEKMDLLDYTDNASNVNSKLEDSIATCIRVLEDKFESIQLSESDSDDEALEHSQVVLKPRKCYVDRPLPHIIGSEKFISDSTLGLSLILQEHEDTTEIEEEIGSLFTRAPRHEIASESKIEGCSGSNGVRKTNEDDVSCSDIISGSEFSQDSDQFFKSIDKNSFEPHNDDFGSDSSHMSFSQKKEVFPNNTNSVPEASKEIENNEVNLPGVNDKVYTKKLMKSVLEQIYSTPHHDIFSKSKPKVDLMEVVEDTTVEIDKRSKETTKNTYVVVNSSVVPFKKGSLCDPSVQLDSASGPLDILPNIPTKILHSLSKNRAKNHNKRRPPSRKKRDISNYTVTADNKVNTETNSVTPLPPSQLLLDTNSKDKVFSDNREQTSVKQERIANLFSPSTDEEDLFTVCSPVSPCEVSSDRLFQPLSYTQISPFHNSITTEQQSGHAPQQPAQQWDPFSEDDPFFFTDATTSWSSQKLLKGSDKLKSGSVSDEIDENLFKKKNKGPSIFNMKSTESSLFDDIEDDSLFRSSFSKPKSEEKSNIPSVEHSEDSSNKSSVSGFKKSFLSDPLSFSPDYESDQS